MLITIGSRVYKADNHDFVEVYEDGSLEGRYMGITARQMYYLMTRVDDAQKTTPIDRLIDVLTKRCRVCGAFGHVDELVLGGITVCPNRARGHEAWAAGSV